MKGYAKQYFDSYGKVKSPEFELLCPKRENKV